VVGEVVWRPGCPDGKRPQSKKNARAQQELTQAARVFGVSTADLFDEIYDGQASGDYGGMESDIRQQAEQQRENQRTSLPKQRYGVEQNRRKDIVTRHDGILIDQKDCKRKRKLEIERERRLKEQQSSGRYGDGSRNPVKAGIADMGTNQNPEQEMPEARSSFVANVSFEERGQRKTSG
jgi:hypothetical protein